MSKAERDQRTAPSLRSRLFLLVAAVAMPLLLLGAVVIYQSYRAERLRAEERLQEQASTLALLLDRELGRVQSVLQTLSACSSLADGDMAGFERELRAASTSLHGAPIGLLDASNRVLMTTGWAPGERHGDRFGAEPLRAVVQSGQPVITGLYRGTISGKPTIAIGVPVLAGKATGPSPVHYVLAAGVPTEVISAVLAGQHLPQGWVGAVLDRNLVVVGRSVDPDRYIGMSAIPVVRAAILAAPAGVVRAPRLDGVFSSTAFAHAPESGFTVLLAVPGDAYEAPWWTTFWITLLVGAALSLSGLAFALVLGRRIAAAIGGLAEGQGCPTPRVREVEQVAARLARTAGERDAAEAALRDLAAQLEQQVAERTEALAESEARLRGIFDAQFQYITLLSPEGRRLDINHGGTAFRGARREDLIGGFMWDAPWWRQNPGDVERIQQAVRRAAAGESSRFEVETLDAEGKPSVVDFSFRPVRDRATQAVRLLIAEGHDVTDLRALQMRLAQTSRLEALGQLSGGVAHDFNNVLQAVGGGVALIARRADDPQAVRRLAAMVTEGVGRGAAVTRRLLGFARRDMLQASPIGVADLLDTLAEVLRHTLGEAVIVITEVPPDLPPILADRAQLETVLVNLATNARDAMPEGGTVRLIAAAETITQPLVAVALAPGAYIRLSVSDDGPGMDPTTLAHAMEPFFTTKPIGKGTGLGLAMARGFAEQSGGAMLIESPPGHGVTVTLWLPQATGADADSEAEADPRQAVAGSLAAAGGG